MKFSASRCATKPKSRKAIETGPVSFSCGRPDGVPLNLKAERQLTQTAFSKVLYFEGGRHSHRPGLGGADSFTVLGDSDKAMKRMNQSDFRSAKRPNSDAEADLKLE